MGPELTTAISWAHIGSSVVAVISGPLVLLLRKGDRRHRRIGHVYVWSMVVLNATAFLIYRLLGTFGPFHIAAVISALTLAAGMRPVLRKQRREGWMVEHIGYMLWSVIGLYAAFFSEILVRSPWRGPFAMVVGMATALLVILGFVVQRPLVRRWSREVGAR